MCDALNRSIPSWVWVTRHRNCLRRNRQDSWNKRERSGPKERWLRYVVVFSTYTFCASLWDSVTAILFPALLQEELHLTSRYKELHVTEGMHLNALRIGRENKKPCSTGMPRNTLRFLAKGFPKKISHMTTHWLVTSSHANYPVLCTYSKYISNLVVLCALGILQS